MPSHDTQRGRGHVRRGHRAMPHERRRGRTPTRSARAKARSWSARRRDWRRSPRTGRRRSRRAARLAQMGLPAVARARWGRSRCRGHGSSSAWLGAPVCGVRAVALAPNSGADFLLKFSSTSTGQGGRDRRRGARSPPHTRPRARAATPPTRPTDPARVPRPPPAFHPRRALSAPPMPTLAAPHMPTAPPALRARSLEPRSRGQLHRQLPRR